MTRKVRILRRIPVIASLLVTIQGCSDSGILDEWVSLCTEMGARSDGPSQSECGCVADELAGMLDSKYLVMMEEEAKFKSGDPRKVLEIHEEQAVRDKAGIGDGLFDWAKAKAVITSAAQDAARKCGAVY